MKYYDASQEVVPKVTYDTVFTRFKHLKLFNDEVLDFLKERSLIEEQYGKNLSKLHKKLSNTKKDHLGEYLPVWEYIMTEMCENANSKSQLSKELIERLEKLVKEIGNHSFFQKSKQYETGLPKLIKDFEEKKLKFSKYQKIIDDLKMDQANQSKKQKTKLEAAEAKYSTAQENFQQVKIRWEGEAITFLGDFESLDQLRFTSLKDFSSEYSILLRQSLLKYNEVLNTLSQSCEAFDARAELDRFANQLQEKVFENGNPVFDRRMSRDMGGSDASRRASNDAVNEEEVSSVNRVSSSPSMPKNKSNNNINNNNSMTLIDSSANSSSNTNNNSNNNNANQKLDKGAVLLDSSTVNSTGPVSGSLVDSEGFSIAPDIQDSRKWPNNTSSAVDQYFDDSDEEKDVGNNQKFVIDIKKDAIRENPDDLAKAMQNVAIAAPAPPPSLSKSATGRRQHRKGASSNGSGLKVSSPIDAYSSSSNSPSPSPISVGIASGGVAAGVGGGGVGGVGLTSSIMGEEKSIVNHSPTSAVAFSNFSSSSPTTSNSTTIIPKKQQPNSSSPLGSNELLKRSVLSNSNNLIITNKNMPNILEKSSTPFASPASSSVNNNNNVVVRVFVTETLNHFMDEGVLKFSIVGEVSLSLPGSSAISNVNSSTGSLKMSLAHGPEVERILANPKICNFSPNNSANNLEISPEHLRLLNSNRTPILKYSVNLLTLTPSNSSNPDNLLPISVKCVWKCEPNTTFLMINCEMNKAFQFHHPNINSSSKSTGSGSGSSIEVEKSCTITFADTDAGFLVPILGAKVKALQCKPSTGTWNPEQSALLWPLSSNNSNSNNGVDSSQINQTTNQQQQLLAKFELAPLSTSTNTTGSSPLIAPNSSLSSSSNSLSKNNNNNNASNNSNNVVLEPVVGKPAPIAMRFNFRNVLASSLRLEQPQQPQQQLQQQVSTLAPLDLVDFSGDSTSITPAASTSYQPRINTLVEYSLQSGRVLIYPSSNL